MTWADRVNELARRLGRKPVLAELIEEAKNYKMTPEEKQAQMESFIRGLMPTGDPRFD